MSLLVGWRLICHDCGSNCDLHHCYVDCDHGEEIEGECENEGFDLCGKCIEKRDNNEEKTQDAEECAGNDVLDCVVDCGY